MTHSGIDLGKLRTRIAVLGSAAKASNQVAEDDRTARNQALVDGDQAGLSYGELGRLADMHPTSVQDVLVRWYAEHPVTTPGAPQ